MPSYRFGENVRFFSQFLGVVFAEVEVVVGALVEGEDVVGGFEFGDCYYADLTLINECLQGGTCRLFV